MNNLANNQDIQENTNQADEGVEFEVDTDNFVESLLKQIIKTYQDAWNKNNEKNEIKFTMTITNHSITTSEGNKAVAYLRLDRSIREKGPAKLIEQEDGKPPIIDEGWETKLLHQEVYFFKSMKERVDPRAMWKEQLYVNCITRLLSAGLEYAELLQRLKPAKEAMQQAAQPKTEEQETEERMNKIGLTTSKEMPAPVDQEYRDWVKKNSEYEK